MKVLLLAALLALPLPAQTRIQRFTLPNGLRVLHLEDHERPLVRAWLQLGLDPADTPPGRQGLPVLALRMLGHSNTGGLKAADFDRQMEDAGIQLSGCLAPDGLTWRLLARSRDQDRALGLLADRLLRPVFDPTVLEGQRVACWLDESRPEASPHIRLREALLRRPGTQPTVTSLGAITLEDLLVFRARVLRPDRAVLVLHGDLGLEQAKRLVLLSLGTWTVQDPLPSYAVLPRAALALPLGTPEALVRIPAPGGGLRVQAVAEQPLDLGPEPAALLGLLVPGDPALGQVKVALEGRWLVATLDGQDATVIRLRERLDALRQRGFTQAELDRARATWEAGRVLESLEPDRKLRAALAEAAGQQVQEPRMQALALAALNDALRRWLDPLNLRLGATGDPEALKALGTEPVSDLHPKP